MCHVIVDRSGAFIRTGVVLWIIRRYYLPSIVLLMFCFSIVQNVAITEELQTAHIYITSARCECDYNILLTFQCVCCIVLMFAKYS